MSQTETHTGSIDGQEHDEVQKKVKSRRPASKLSPKALSLFFHTCVKRFTPCPMANDNLRHLQIPPSGNND